MDILTTVLGVVVIVAGGLAALQQGQLKTLRDTNADLRARRDDLEKDVDRLEADVTHRDEQLGTSEAEKEALRRVVTGEVQLTAITDLLEHHIADSSRGHARIEKAIDNMLAEVRAGRPL